MRTLVPKGYVCYRSPRPIAVSGALDDPSWELAPWTDDFVDILGESGPRPRFRTRAKLLWDDDYLYVGANLEEPHVCGWLTERESIIFQDNDFEVFLDPDGDNHDYYEIEINARNTVWDLRLTMPYREAGTALSEWHVNGLVSAVDIRGTLNDPSDVDDGWSVEMAFPWKDLAPHANRPCPPEHGDRWRINFSRVEWRYDVVEGGYVKRPETPEDNWVWTPQGVVDMHRPDRWGFLQFSTQPAGSDALREEPHWDTWSRLHELHEAQRAIKAIRGQYTAGLADLGLNVAGIKLESNGEVYLAELNGWTIDGRSRLARSDRVV